jgi:hypothetical protein
MVKSYTDVEAALLFLHVIKMSKEEWEKHDEVVMVAAVCGWTEARAAQAVARAYVQFGLPPEGSEPSDADLAEMLLSVGANEPAGLQYDRFLAALRGWSLERARRALAGELSHARWQRGVASWSSLQSGRGERRTRARPLWRIGVRSRLVVGLRTMPS